MIAVPLVGCGGAEDRPAGQAEPPAHVESSRAESDLATITLTPQAVERLGIETTEIELRVVARSRTYGGELVVPPGRSMTIVAPVAGTIAAPEGGRLPSPGGRLAEEQEVLRLLPLSPPGQDLVRLEAEALARFEAAQLQAQRAEQLLRDRAGSVRAYEEARAELAVAEAALQALRRQLELLNRTAATEPGGLVALAMVSPMRARLGSLLVGLGQPVAQSAPLFDVFADDPLWIRVPIYVGDLGSIDSERAAAVHSLGQQPVSGGSTAGGQVRTARPVSGPPSADPEAATVDIFYEIENEDSALQPGQKVGVTLVLTDDPASEEESLVVLRSAILYDFQGGTWLYENLAPLTYVRRRVEVSHIVGDYAVLVRGPAPGTVVVTSGAAELFGTEFEVAH